LAEQTYGCEAASEMIPNKKKKTHTTKTYPCGFPAVRLNTNTGDVLLPCWFVLMMRLQLLLGSMLYGRSSPDEFPMPLSVRLLSSQRWLGHCQTNKNNRSRRSSMLLSSSIIIGLLSLDGSWGGSRFLIRPTKIESAIGETCQSLGSNSK
jgi:hypothetical protein